MADEKDNNEDDSRIFGGIHYSMSAGFGSQAGGELASANTSVDAAIYEARQRDESTERWARIKRARAKTARLERERTEALQAKRDAEAEENAERLKEHWRLKLSGKMTSDDFEHWWKSNKLRLIEENMQESESALMREAQQNGYGVM